MTSTPPDWDEPGFVPYTRPCVEDDELVARAREIYEELKGKPGWPSVEA